MPDQVEEVATFYTMYYTEPVGTYVLEVCKTAPCSFMGADEIIDYISADARDPAGRDHGGRHVHAVPGRMPCRLPPGADDAGQSPLLPGSDSGKGRRVDRRRPGNSSCTAASGPDSTFADRGPKT